MRWTAEKMCVLLALALLAHVRTVAAQIFDISSFRHTPPQVSSDNRQSPLRLKIPGAGIRRARVLAATAQGYRAYDMSADGPEFTAEVPFGELAVLKYQFQIEDRDRRLHESQYFVLRQPANGEVEAAIVKLEQEVEQLGGQAQQLENALFAVKRADPAALARNKNQELARALVVLGQKERLLKEARNDLKKDLKTIEEQLDSGFEGESKAEAGRLLEDAGIIYRYGDM